MPELLSLLARPFGETLLMVAASTAVASALGFPIGVLLCLIGPGGLMERPKLRAVLDRAVNALRSFPFVILMILLFPLSRLVVGTSIGTVAAVVPLSVAAAPFVARIVESALSEVDRGVVEAAVASAASPARIVLCVLVPEAAPALVSGLTLTVINLVGYSAMAGAIGGGGLGDLAVRYGYQRFRADVMAVAVVAILVFVEAVQITGTGLSRRIKAAR
jgi:D-methionine transport system permease protein